MKLKVHVLFLLFVIFFTLVYTFVAVRPLSSELQFIPNWTITSLIGTQNPSSITDAQDSSAGIQDPKLVNNVQTSNNLQEDTSADNSQISQDSNFAQEVVDDKSSSLIPFKLGQVLGYFTEDGKIKTSCTFAQKASISKNYYSVYSLGDDKIDFYTSHGQKLCTVQDQGFPFIDDDRLYLFLPGGNSFSQYSTKGKKLWTYEGFVPITAFSSSKSGAVVSFADGKLLVFDSDGTLLQEFVPGGSKYSIIFGADVSSDGKYIACLSGLEKQRIVLANVEKTHTVISFFKYMEDDLNSQSLVQFSKDALWLYYANASGLGIVNCETKEDYCLKVDGRISSIVESEIPGTFFVLTKEQKKYTVYVIENFINLSGSFSFTANSAFIQTNGNSLFVGRDDKISKIDLLKK